MVTRPRFVRGARAPETTDAISIKFHLVEIRRARAGLADHALFPGVRMRSGAHRPYVKRCALWRVGGQCQRILFRALRIRTERFFALQAACGARSMEWDSQRQLCTKRLHVSPTPVDIGPANI